MDYTIHAGLFTDFIHLRQGYFSFMSLNQSKFSLLRLSQSYFFPYNPQKIE